jgi:hypothetical protein
LIALVLVFLGKEVPARGGAEPILYKFAGRHSGGRSGTVQDCRAGVAGLAANIKLY